MVSINIKEKLRAYLRIMRVAAKPTTYEFKSTLKVTGLGVIIIGGIGFMIVMSARLIQ